MQTQQPRTNRAKSAPLRYEPTAGRSEFVEIIQAAVDPLPESRPKKRVKHEDSCATGLENLVRTSIKAGAPLDAIRRLQAALNRAVNVVIRERWPLSERALSYATGAETAANSRQNEDTHAVLTNGTLGDVERLHESTRVQRDMSEILMESLEARASQLRAAGSR